MCFCYIVSHINLHCYWSSQFKTQNLKTLSTFTHPQVVPVEHFIRALYINSAYAQMCA